MTSLDVEPALVRDLFHHEVAGLAPPPDLIRRVRRSHGRRAVTRRAAQGCLAAAVLGAGAVGLVAAAPGGPTRPATPPAHDTAYVVRHFVAEMSAVSSQVLVGTVSGSGTARLDQQQFAFYDGKMCVWSSSEPTSPCLAPTSTVWFGAGSAPGSSPATTCNGRECFEVNALATPQMLRSQLSALQFTVVGTPTVDGQATYELTQGGQPGGWQFYVNQQTFLPVRAVGFWGAPTSKMTFRLLTPTPADTARFGLTPPPG